MKKLLFILFLAPSLWAGTARHVIASGGATSGQCLTLGTAGTWQYVVGTGLLAQAGDTVWLHAGTYYTDLGQGGRIEVSGSAGSPIIIRNWNNERVILQPLTHDETGDTESCSGLPGTLDLHRYWRVVSFDSDVSYIWLWGLEIRMPDETGQKLYGEGCVFLNDYCKVINCIIHDAVDVGVRDQNVQGTEVVGNLIYFCGRQSYRDIQDGYAGYVQNNSLYPQKVWRDNIMFENWGIGVQFYSSSGGISNMKIVGNTIFNNGQLRDANGYPTCDAPSDPNVYSDLHRFQTNFVLGSSGGAQVNDTVMNNVIYYSAVDGVTAYNTVYIPAPTTTNLTDSRVDSNYIVNRAGISEGLVVGLGSGATGVGNVVSGPQSGLSGETNSLYANFSTGRSADIVQRVNPYESNREHITVINWSGSATVKFLPQCLTNDSTYRLVSATNYYGAVMDSGTWHTGDSITITMSEITMATPVSSVSPDSTWGQQNDPVNPQPYFAALVLIGGGTGAVEEEEQTSAPIVSSPIYAGSTSVSGTSSEEDGTVIVVSVNGVPLAGEITTRVWGGVWTEVNLDVLVAGDEITAKATASGKTESNVSNTVTVRTLATAGKRLWIRR